ncbi:hypothetical protein DPMN_010196 [Dreissena polymorpha]|uniref:Uncharacterized protein n=1 Tax=Dreissena polymorpha TaxID=45954 RepID=A0A9D4N1R4_DREPO|nr:hypothetical protein DPMN_010196 [Dreissena polymorpha]
MMSSCILTVCNRTPGRLETKASESVHTLLKSAVERHDCEIRDRVHAILDAEGEKATVTNHHNCHCTYTSKGHIKRYLGNKRKDGALDYDDAPVVRRRRSQEINFDFKTHFSLCSKVIHCEKIALKDTIRFEDIILKICSERRDELRREVELRCHGVQDLAAEEAQYHLRCLNYFRKLPGSSLD